MVMRDLVNDSPWETAQSWFTGNGGQREPERDLAVAIANTRQALGIDAGEYTVERRKAVWNGPIAPGRVYSGKAQRRRASGL